MSEKTGKKMEEAIKAHYQDEIEGGFMTDFFISIGGINSDSETTQYVHESSASPIHSIIGLARMGFRFVESIGEEDE